MKRSMRLFIQVITILPMFACLASAQTIPAIANVPSCASASDRANLAQQRQALSNQRDQLRSAILRHDSACQSVLANSSQASICSQEQAQLTNDKNRHIESTTIFNQSVKAAETLCGSTENLSLLVSRIKGSVFLESATGRTRMTENSTLKPGASISTDANSAIVLQFSTGEKVEVGPNSSFTFEPDTREPTLRQGLLRLVHECLSVNGNCLRRVPRVHTLGAVLAVRGTDFLVETSASGTTISVYHGSVEVTGMATGAPVLLRDAERVQVDSQGKIGTPISIPSATAPNWWN
jgi:hypothetical protein